MTLDKSAAIFCCQVAAGVQGMLGNLFCEKHRYQNKKIRLLKVCYVPVTSATSSRLFYSFFTVAIYSTNEANEAGSTCH
jgi:hypothetical protein